MSLGLLIFLVVAALLILIGIIVLVIYVPTASPQLLHKNLAAGANLRNLVAAQRAQQTVIDKTEGPGSRRAGDKAALALAAASESGLTRRRVNASRMTLEKRLRYAGWKMTPLQYRCLQVFATAVAFTIAFLFFLMPTRIMALLLMPLVVDTFLEKAMNKRFKAFDHDYPVLLLSYVSLLRTGMSTLTGLEAAGKGLDDDAVVRFEVELLMERLRLGLTEEQAINAFGENVHHPELELFVQSLLLSRRVGGTLSTTLERLAKQVRRRQQFREQAVAAVSMEKYSMIFVAGIMSFLLGFVFIKAPDLIRPAWSHPMGRWMMELGVALILAGFFWGKKVTNIKV